MQAEDGVDVFPALAGLLNTDAAAQDGARLTAVDLAVCGECGAAAADAQVCPSVTLPLPAKHMVARPGSLPRVPCSGMPRAAMLSCALFLPLVPRCPAVARHIPTVEAFVERGVRPSPEALALAEHAVPIMR